MRTGVALHVLLIFGPGGISKTSLLHEFAYICEEAQVPATYLDAHNLEPVTLWACFKSIKHLIPIFQETQ